MSQIMSQQLTGINTFQMGLESPTSNQVETYQIILNQDEDGRYVATCPDLPGVVTDGASEDEALKNVTEAILAMQESKGIKKDFMIIYDSI